MTGELAVAFNDVDYCLKVRKHGWSVVYDPLRGNAPLRIEVERLMRIPRKKSSALTARWRFCFRVGEIRLSREIPTTIRI